MRKFHTFELALLLALAAALLWGAWSLHRQDDLQAKMIRLHVIANSDNAADQALKLQGPRCGVDPCGGHITGVRRHERRSPGA